MKKRLLVVLIIVLIGGIFMANTTSARAASERVITVSGNATISYSPDIAYINIGVSEISADSKQAFMAAAQKMNAIIEDLKARGISEDCLETTQLSVFPNYSYADRGRVQNGYTASNSIRVTIKQLENAAEILTKAIELGANQNSGIEFALLERDTAYNEALTKAIQNAQGKANAIAKAVNMELATPSEIIENKDYNSVGMARAVAFDSAASNVQIESGTIKVTASVTLIYKS